jgi:transposase
MIRAGYLSPEDRADLIALARDGSSAHRLARHANALVLLDDGWSCERVAAAPFLDDGAIRRWHRLFLKDGLDGLTRFERGGGASRLSTAQEAALKSWIGEALPRSTRELDAYVKQEVGVVDESRSGRIALLHRLGLAYSKPETIGRELDVEK